MAKMSMSSPFHIGLVSMPWPAFNRPSIQLGCLGAYLRVQGVKTSLLHPYLEVAHRLGDETYQWIASEVWLCEALYAAILYPEKYQEAKRLAEQQVGVERRSDFDFDALVTILDDHLHGFVASTDFDRFDLLGFSICLNQLLPTLCAVKYIRARYPDLAIVLGGSSTHPLAAEVLVQQCGANYVIWGEGEQALHGLCNHLHRGGPLPDKVFSGGGWGTHPTGELRDLADLPVPNYTDYMDQMRLVFGQQFRPVFPLEFSRGCWWGKCVFCNLNLQWQGYRFKKSSQAQSEVALMVEKYQALDFTFTDNALPVRQSREFFKWCGDQSYDLDFFAEIRGSQCGDELLAMRRGGLTRVQVGIESLSSSLLKRLKKGLRVIDNLAIMRDGVACHVEIDGNLIVDFPSSTAEEVEESLANLDFVLPFKPLATASFFLGLSSYVERHPTEFSIKNKTVHPHNRHLFPEEVLTRFPQLIQSYRGDRTIQQKRWRAVVKKVGAWQKFHQERGKDLYAQPVLSYRDGGNFIVLRQEQLDGPVLHHTLKGMSRRLYLYILKIRTFAEITAFCPMESQKIECFLADLVAKKIMFKEDDAYLSLAVRMG